MLSGPVTRLPTLVVSVPRWLLLKVPVATVKTGTPVPLVLGRVWTRCAVLHLLRPGTRTLTRTRLHRLGVVRPTPWMVIVLLLVALIIKLVLPRTLNVTLWPSLPLLISRSPPFPRLVVAGRVGLEVGLVWNGLVRMWCSLERKSGPL